MVTGLPLDAVLTVVNPHTHNAQDTQIQIRGGPASNVRATVLTSSDIHAHNTFDQPHAIEPSEKTIADMAMSLSYQFAPASVTKLEFDLA
jgi:alpha-L-arabinofuranosidase